MVLKNEGVTPSSQVVTLDQSYAIDYTYTNQGLLDTLVYPQSTSGARVQVKYGYQNGILSSVTDWTLGYATTVYWTANAKNARGQTTQETLGNGVVTNRNFDAVTGWLNSIQSGVGGGTGLQNHSYLHDLVGNVTQRQDTRSSGGLTENFYYDNLYRLDYSQLNGVTNLDLTYDAMGNITARSDVNGNATWSYHSTKKHAVTSTGSGGTSFAYDDNGNMISRGGSSNITWSSYNLPTGLSTSTESATFYYGPNRQYYRQDYSGPGGIEVTHYVGGILEKVYDGSTYDWRHYIKAEGKTVAIVSRKSSGANTVHYALEDNQGSGSVLVDSSGTGYVRQSYAAFGLPRDGNDWDGVVPSGDEAAINAITRRGYTGHSMLAGMGLIHMNGRVQDAITGRFLSPDPNVPEPGFTQSYNRYAYVRNNPLTFIDPSGFFESFMETQCRLDGFQVAPGSEWAAASYEQLCAEAIGFTAAMEMGLLTNVALHRQERAGCGAAVWDCEGYDAIIRGYARPRPTAGEADAYEYSEEVKTSRAMRKRMKLTETEDSRHMSISLTMSPKKGVDEATTRQYIATANAGWNFSMVGSDGISRSFSLDLSFTAKRGDLQLRPCVPDICTTGLGAADVGGRNVWYSPTGRPDTPVHELGHVFGYADNRAPGSGSIMSPDANRGITERDFDLLWDAYRRGK